MELLDSVGINCAWLVGVVFCCVRGDAIIDGPDVDVGQLG